MSERGPSFCIWKSTAPNPYEDASAERIVFLSGSYIALHGAEQSALLVFGRHFLDNGPKTINILYAEERAVVR